MRRLSRESRKPYCKPQLKQHERLQQVTMAARFASTCSFCPPGLGDR